MSAFACLLDRNEELAADVARNRAAEIVERVGPVFAVRASEQDRMGLFVADNYRELKLEKFFSAGVPEELGGGGVSHSQMCDALRALAHFCPSTALAVAMHQHLVMTLTWRWKNAGGSDALLRKVAQNEAVLVSTGASDWLESCGSAAAVEGGYRVSATKRFASGAPMGDYLITSAPLVEPGRGERVIHFVTSLRGEGVRLLDDWDTMGMRATGSNAVELDNVFVPSAAVSLDRARGAWHASYNVVLAMAMPMVMSVYLGIAERARDLAVESTRTRRGGPDEIAILLTGELESELTSCRLAVADMVRLAEDGEMTPTMPLSSQIVIRKTLAAKSAIATVEKAMELVGGSAFYRRNGLEQLLRDVHGAQFHPMPEKAQQRFTGRILLG